MKPALDKVGKIVKIGIKIKLDPTLSEKIIMDNMFSEYKRAFNFVIDYIYDIYYSYRVLEEPLEDTCSECNEERFLGFEKDKKLICGTCFRKKWSFISVRNMLCPKKRGEIIIKKFPLLTHNGIYQGAIKEASANFSSYIKRINQRKIRQKAIEKEINKTNKNFLKIKSDYFYYNKQPVKKLCAGCNETKLCYMIDKDKIECLCEKCFKDYKILKKKFKKLRKLKKDVKKPFMKKDALLFYDYKLAYFTKDYNVEISQPNIKDKLKINAKVGDYQKRYIDMVFRDGYDKEVCKRGYHIMTTPKLTKQGSKYYLIYPYQRECKIYNTNEAIKKGYNADTIAVLSFGLKRPINCLLKDGKKLKFRVFGDGGLMDRKDKEELNQKRIKELIQRKYEKRHGKDGKEVKRRFNKFRKKTKNKLMLHSYRTNHYLSYKLADYLKSNDVSLIIMRDLSKIKDFSYAGLLGKNLHRWAIMQLQNMIEYKANMEDISVFKLKYSETNNLKCCKCGEKFENKVLTDKLNNAKRFKCAKCNYQNDYYFNDSLNLLQSFNEWKPSVSNLKR